jgi:two-component system, NarL family, nitrate/nitrite response regulator NarL
MVRLIVVTQIRLYREGLAQALERDERFQVVATMSSVAQAIATVSEHSSDIILLDSTMPGALDGVRDLTGAAPSTRIIALGLSEVEPNIVAWAEAGIAAYVSCDVSLDGLMGCLESVARGEFSCSPRVAAALMRRVALLAGRQPVREPDARVTDREQEVLSLVDEGLSNKQIAARLLIEVATVKNHIHNILEKLGAKRRGEAAALMRRQGIRPSRVLGARLQS